MNSSKVSDLCVAPAATDYTAARQTEASDIHTVSDSTLLRILAPRCDTRMLLAEFGNLGSLASTEPAVLATASTPASARNIAAAFELGRRASRDRITRHSLDTAERTYAYFAPHISHLPCESLRIALLDSRLRCTRQVTISDGTLDETTAHPRDILHPAVVHRAAGFILAHNHPTGDPSPSRPDREITDRISEAAELLRIRLIDHIIVGKPSDHHDPYFSFREAGLL